MIVVKFDRAGYDWWGRPAQMDLADPKDCGHEDDHNPVLRLEISLQITNNSIRTMTIDTWHGQFYKTTGQPAMTCHWMYNRNDARPEIPPGVTANVTYMAWVYPSERIGWGEITDANIGKSNRIEVPQNLPLP